MINLRGGGADDPAAGAVDWQAVVAGRPLIEAYVAQFAAFGVRSVLLGGGQAYRFVRSHDGAAVCGATIAVVPSPDAAIGDVLRAVHDRLDDHFLVADRPYRVCDLAAFVATPPAPGERPRRLICGARPDGATGIMLLSKAAAAGDAPLDAVPSDWNGDGDIVDFTVGSRDPRSLPALEAALRRPAAFLDRDGVINLDHGYVYRCEDLEFTPTAVAGIRGLNRAGYRVLVVTNQAGVAHGYYGTAHVERFHDHLQQRLLEHGAHIDGFYYSPTHPAGSVAEFTRVHDDRKPGAGMLLRGMRDWPTDIRRSFLIGDKESDVEAARRAGLAAVRVPTDICDLAAESAAMIERLAG